jgi:hypothetical protein
MQESKAADQPLQRGAKPPCVCVQSSSFLNVHKIRVDSDNKRCARCTEMALTQSRKVNI